MSEQMLRRRGLWVVIDGINKKLNAKGDPYMEYKLADRDKAADMLRQYIQMIEPPKQHVVLENLSIGEPPKPADLEEGLGEAKPPEPESHQPEEGAGA